MKKVVILNSIILFLALVVSIVIGLFLVRNVFADENVDVTPPEISNVRVSKITATSSVITWDTNEKADSLVNYGLSKNYGISRDPNADKTKHTILIDDLLPNMVYYFRVTSADANGNQGISSNFIFETPSITQTKPEGEKNVGEKDNLETDSEKEKYDKQYETENNYNAEFDKSGENNAQYNQNGKQDDKFRKVGGESANDAENRGSKDYVSAEKEAGTMGDILESLKGINNEKNLEIIQNELQKIAENISDPLTILLNKADLEIGINYVIVKWKTNKKSNSLVSMVLDSEYNENAENPYAWQEGMSEELVKDHVVEITGLSPATTYHFRVSSETSLNIKTKSKDMKFTTESVLPEIFNLTVAKVEENAATIEWGTNVPCSSVLEYTNLVTGKSKLSGNSSYITSHSIRITDLDLDTYYSGVVKVENEDGKRAQSKPFTFLTVKDERPPVISKVKTDSTIYPGSDNKIQTVITWATDEPAKCQFLYRQGFGGKKDDKELKMEDNYSQDHIQVTTDLQHATVYKFRINCYDKANNLAKSKDFTILTPTKEQNIIDIILSNFEDAFGWTKNVGK